MINVREWKLQLEILTPMFVSGADPSATELRAPSIRGELRYWFRALAGPRVNYDPAALRTLEAVVFGSTSRASAFALRVTPTNLPVVHLQRALRPGVAYLAYGMTQYQQAARGQVLVRPALAPGARATVWIRLRPDAAPELRAALLATLWTWGHLGGIGARTRRGYGSFCLAPDPSCSGEGFGWPSVASAASARDAAQLLAQGLEQARDAVASLADSVSVGLGMPDKMPDPPTAPFFVLDKRHTVIQLAQISGGDWTTWLETAGNALKSFRRAQKQDAKMVAEYLEKRVSHETTSNGTVSRALLGLPLGFHFPEGNRKAEVTATMANPKTKEVIEVNRRASPFTIRCGPPPHGARGCTLLMVYSASRFLPYPANLVLTGTSPVGEPLPLRGKPRALLSELHSSAASLLGAQIEQVKLP